MTQQYNNELRGVLFTNDRRESDGHPHYQGQSEIEGVSYWLSGWIQQPKKGGDDFVSLALRRKDAPKDAPRPAKDDPNLRGALFVNDRKDTPDKPDYTGRCQISDVQWWVSGWIKAPRDAGDDFISLQFEKAGAGAAKSTGRLDARAMLAQARARVPGSQKDAPPHAAASKDDFDDDIPF